MLEGVEAHSTAGGWAGEVLEALSHPSAYPHAPADVEVIQTHVSWVFLAGDRAYKVKKPVNLGFVDFRTLPRRRWACFEEVRLNTALAPGVYQRVGAITRQADGSLRVDGPGQPVEPVLQMRRLPSDRMLERLLDTGNVDERLMGDLAVLLARFHATAPTGPGVIQHATPAAIQANLLENTQQTQPFALERGQPGVRTLSPVLHQFLATRSGQRLAALEGLLERRLHDGRIRDGHGDLHAGNICVLPTGIVIFDRIEFAARFRCGDVAADLAFLVMDLHARGFAAHARALVHHYSELTSDRDLSTVLPLYTAYRAVVRGKTLSLAAADPLIGPAQRESSRRAALRAFLLAASYDLAPSLVLTCGLPATGKSTVAQVIGTSLQALVLRSDVRRKQLTGRDPTVSAAAPFEQGIYHPDVTQRTYAALLEETSQALAQGRTVVIDASFSKAQHRRPFSNLAASAGVAFVLVHVSVPPQVAARRLAARAAQPDASDADPVVYEAMRTRLEPPDEIPGSQQVHVDGQHFPEEAAAAVVDLLVTATRTP